MSKVERMKIMGHLEIFKTDLKGTRKIRDVKNTIVDGGEIWVAEIMAGEESGGAGLSYATGELGYGLQYVQIGWGTTSAGTNQTSLQSQAGITVTAASLSNDVATPYNKIVCRGTYGTQEGTHNTESISEAGLFSNTSIPTTSTDTASRMFNRTTFGAISKTDLSDFSLTLQWTITFGEVL